MGQQWVGVLLGCVKPKGLAMRDEEGAKVDGEGLLDRWEALMRKTHKGEFKKDHWKASARRVPDFPSVDEGDSVIGFWVAGIEEDNTDSGERMASAALSAIAKTPRYERALERWNAFAAWAKDQGVKLPKPKLRHLQTEVA
jgi:hypothetical protein